jgi:hypothetical protein
MQLEHEDLMAANLVEGRDERYTGVPRLYGRQGRSQENVRGSLIIKPSVWL